MPVLVRRAQAPAEIDFVRGLLLEYAAYLNRSLGEEHICLKDYEREVAALPGPYAEPDGVILLASIAEQGKPAGCVTLKPLKPSFAVAEDEVACEMKRLWVGPEFRGQSIGLELTRELIRYAQGRGYTAMYLDTVPAAMQSANRIYQALGFAGAERYNTNPILGAQPSVAVEFFRLSLL
jgi:ribosomal protein S18 acetylase RimI-like enzyme